MTTADFGRVAQRNPFYLLSALCMLLGCYALNQSFVLQTGAGSQLLLVLGALNLYEALLIWFGAFLWTRREAMAEAYQLLCLEGLFLLDPTFLYQEAELSHAALGVLLACLLGTLAIIKVRVLLRVLGLRCDPREWALLLARFALLVGLPALLAVVRELGGSQAAAIHAGWWAAGLLLVVELPADRAPLLRLIQEALGISVMAHLVAAGWIGDVPFSVCHLAPLALGLAVRTVGEGHERQGLGLMLLAILLSNQYGSLEGVAWTPFRLMLVAAGGLGLWLNWRGRHPALRGLTWLSLAGALAGKSPEAIGERAVHIVGQAGSMIPSTTAQWGALGMVGGFLFLGAGAWRSLGARGGLAEAVEVEVKTERGSA